MNLLFITNIPSPYRVGFFNELGKYCNLTVIFEKQSSSERNEKWIFDEFNNFEGIILNGISVKPDMAIDIRIFKHIKKDYYDHIIIANPLTLLGILTIVYLNIKRINFLIESDGGFPKQEKSLKEIIKKYCISSASGWFSTSNIHDQYYRMYGARNNGIYRYPFTSIYKSEVIDKIIPREMKMKIRNKLNINEKKVIVSVGQFIKRKGFDVLLKACESFNEDVGVYIIGGEPLDEYNQIIKRLNLKNIHFINFLSKDDLIRYYQAADLFVLPTREDIWGLVINEAMAQGLPIITTDRCIAGTELVEDGVNGFIVKVDDIADLHEKIDRILGSESIQSIMSKNSLHKINEFTIENMAKVHIDIFGKLHDKVKRLEYE